MSHLVTAIPGASQCFKGSVVAYANDIKTGVLGVSAEDIEVHGAVSRQVVEQMALGACRVFKSDYAIATSGVAGPSGGTVEKPVGTVWIGWAAGEKVVSKMYQYGNIRERTIVRTSETGLILLKKMIEKGEF
jgi:nicotinamide-nucleotide amidase